MITIYIAIKEMWGDVKKLTNKTKKITPRIITFNNKVLTSIKKITNIANEYYKEKITKIRNKFYNNLNITPIQILEALIPKYNTTFSLPIPTENDILNIIKKSKGIFSVGNDIINMKIIKRYSRNDMQ